MLKYLFYFTYILLSFFYININNSYSEFLDALILKIKSGNNENLSGNSIEYPSVNKKNNPQYLAFSVKDDDLNESIAVVELNRKGFNSFIKFLSPKNSREVAIVRKINNILIEFTWNFTGNRILFLLKRKKFNIFNIIIDSSTSLESIKPNKINWNDSEKKRFHFCYIGKNEYDFVYLMGDNNLCKPRCKSKICDDQIIAKGLEIVDPIFYNESIKQIIYCKYEDNNPGIYQMNPYNGKEEKIINIDSFTETIPIYSNGKIAFATNFNSNYKGSTKERVYISGDFKLYVSTIKKLKNIKASTSLTNNENILFTSDNFIIKPKRGRNFNNLNRKQIIWCDDKIFFRNRDGDKLKIRWKSFSKTHNNNGYYDFSKEEKGKFKLQKKIGPSYYKYRIKPKEINSFDVYVIDNYIYIIISARVNLKIEEELFNIDGSILLMYRFEK